jgi:hypothetical protein
MKTLSADQKIVYPTETPLPAPRTASTASSPAPKPTPTPHPAEPAEASSNTRLMVIGAVVGGLALVLVAGGVAGLLWLTVFRAKPKAAKRDREADDEVEIEEEDEPRKPTRPAKLAKREAKKPTTGGAPDEFPGFG